MHCTKVIGFFLYLQALSACGRFGYEVLEDEALNSTGQGGSTADLTASTSSAGADGTGLTSDSSNSTGSSNGTSDATGGTSDATGGSSNATGSGSDTTGSGGTTMSGSGSGTVDSTSATGGTSGMGGPSSTDASTTSSTGTGGTAATTSASTTGSTTDTSTTGGSTTDTSTTGGSTTGGTSAGPCASAGNETYLASFDAGVEGFEVTGAGQPTLTWNGSVGNPDAGALDLLTTAGGAVQVMNRTSTNDLSGRTLSVAIYTDNSAVEVRLFAQNGPSWSSTDVVVPIPGQWTCLSMDIDNPDNPDNGHDPSIIDNFGLDIRGSGVRVYIDQFAY